MGKLLLLFFILIIGLRDSLLAQDGDSLILNKAYYSILNLSATDALGRSFSAAAGYQREKKTVGVFYSLWLGQHKRGQKGIYDIQKLLNTNPAALNNIEGVPESPMGEFHFWGEPLYGYYSMSDPWVVTRHIELLTNAGVDYLCIDATNRVVYTRSIENLFGILLRFMEQGFNVPKIVFYTNSLSGTTVDDLYNQFYKSGKYDKLWFRPVAKPMIIGITENNAKASDMTKYNEFTDFVKPAMQEYFDVRESQWPNGDYNPYSIPWMSWQYPQWNHNGTVAVPVAQHSHSVIAASAQHPESSRGYNNATKKVEADWTAGANFQTMWDAVFASEKKIDQVLITSFNEWMAIKYANAHGNKGVFFVDVYNHEFSRDIEMMKGGYNDNFYLQLVRNIRKFKLTDGRPSHRATKTIDIRKAAENDWRDVDAVYVDVAGDALARNFSNASGTGSYTDSSNRNDITEIKVAHDKKNVYFMIKTAADITPYNGKDVNWMNILIGNNSNDDSFEGYRYIVNRKPSAKGTTSLERSAGGYNWKRVAKVKYVVKGNLMQVAIPLAALGLREKNCSFQFKIADNVTHYGDIMDYYVSGDSAPIGRLSYSY
ncbi:hypothetical protein [Agriterribacter sp.]|uniref:hypothetical protein n=1 Tax=Agriterribacter sp. TaxID=2821509 RepID=UPI002B74F613|nr:hypothetical protein [Agriterribacter sp.]HRP54663.1 hypothetical protein [Agriterribacter sp.]